MEGERDMGIVSSGAETPNELLLARISHLKQQLESINVDKAENSDPDMTQIYDKRISDLMTQISELESKLN